MEEDDLISTTREEEEHLLERSNMSISLHSYDDLFNKFDARQYAHRSLSEDFLSDLKRGSADKDESKLELRFILPREKRNAVQEITIKKRLKEHFHRHQGLVVREKASMIRQGFFFIFLGIILMFISTYIIATNPTRGIGLSFLVILFEPGGWYLFWEGLNLIIFKSTAHNPNIEFYRKMSRANIIFSSY